MSWCLPSRWAVLAILSIRVLRLIIVASLSVSSMKPRSIVLGSGFDSISLIVGPALSRRIESGCLRASAGQGLIATNGHRDV